jgi:hypothetical protein
MLRYFYLIKNLAQYMKDLLHDSFNEKLEIRAIAKVILNANGVSSDLHNLLNEYFKFLENIPDEDQEDEFDMDIDMEDDDDEWKRGITSFAKFIKVPSPS